MRPPLGWVERVLIWQYSRRSRRRYMHAAVPWRPCYTSQRGLHPCWRCYWRQVSGRNRRDEAAYIARAAGRRAAFKAAGGVPVRRPVRRPIEPRETP